LITSVCLMLALSPSAGAEQPLLFDPLRPATTVAVEMSNPAVESALPRLSMIVRNARQHYAVIDGRPLRVGEQWAGYRVLAIHPSSVLLGREGEQPVELELLSGAVIKKPVPNNAAGNDVGSPQGDPRRAESIHGFRNRSEENIRP